MLKSKSKSHQQNSGDLEALLKSSSSNNSLSSTGGGSGSERHSINETSNNKNGEFVSLKRRAKIRQQEKYGRIRLVLVVVGVVFIIFLSFFTNSRQYEPQIAVVIPHDDPNLPGPAGVTINNNDTSKCLNATAKNNTSANHSQKNHAFAANIEELHSINNFTINNNNKSELYNQKIIISNLTKSYSTVTTISSISTAHILNYNYTTTNTTTVPHGYLIYGPECKIPDIDPLAKDVMRLFHKEEYRPCSTKPALTYVRQYWHNDTVKLHLNFSAVSSYLSVKKDYLECCYQEIHRAGEYTHADDKTNLTSCKSFDQVVQLPQNVEFILVKCKRISHKKPEIVYTNAHALVRRKPEVVMRFKERDKVENKTKPLSVLLIGIDSISRLNLIRAMPNTAQHLYNTGWMELKGYNKIDDNTFPNLMAILTGFNNSMAYKICNPKKVGKLDACPIIWNTFKEMGYATAYAEDEVSINTFNYHKYGFLEPPVDHYLRPYAIAAEKYLHKTKLSGLNMCLGYQNYADHIYQYALDFTTQYKGNPYFGLFWTNTFSHNDISSTSCMDLKMKEYIVQLERQGTLNESLVIFFSDHGMRFGNVRQLLTGWFEERLPFIFFSLPEWFKSMYPEYLQNFKINRNRLTTPYDFHITLKHILQLSGANVNLTAESCSLCQSLFEEVSYNRSCTDAGITQHWCTCIPYEKSDKSAPEVRDAVHFAIQSINDELKSYKSTNTSTSGTRCSKLKLKKISSAKIAKITSEKVKYYLVVFEAYPGGGEFEATVKYHFETSTYELTGSISRLNAYGTQGYCVNDDKLKKYCYCGKYSHWV